jgi:hypothetical protein
VTAGVDRLDALYSAIDIVRRGGTISLLGVYGGMADPMPMLTLFDKQVQLRMGQANVKKWVDDIMPLLTDEDPLGVDTFASHTLSLDEAPHAYDIFQKKQDGAVKIVLKPGRRSVAEIAHRVTGTSEQHPCRDGHRVIGEPLIEPAQQHQVDRGGDAVTPVRRHHGGEQPTMHVVHRLVVIAYPAGPHRVSVEDHRRGVLSQVDGEPAHLRELTDDLVGEDGGRVPPPDDAGDMSGQSAHPVRIGGDVDRSHHRAQVTGHRRLPRQHPQRRTIHVAAQSGQRLQIGQHSLSGVEVDAQQAGCGALNGIARELAHPDEISVERIQLLVELGTRHAVPSRS